MEQTGIYACAETQERGHFINSNIPINEGWWGFLFANLEV